jgi:glycerol dehydrogenase-like iron-containing ADH family enzyme
MPAKDLFHNAVKIGLQKDGWTITHDPLHLKIGTAIEMYIDLAADKLIAAEKTDRKIAVEVKSFTAPSTLSEFHLAIGQFINYRYALEELRSDRKLYLAVPNSVYQEFFKISFVNSIIQRSQINLIIYNPETEEIFQWIP